MTTNASPLLWGLLVGLLCCSAFFSASETALFSLETSARRTAGRRVGKLLDDQRGLLVTILLGNLVVNLLFFAFASRLGAGAPARQQVAWGLVALFAILIFGEVFPKTLALRTPLVVARAAALPLGVLVALFAPARAAADRLLDLFYRMLGEAGREEHPITTETLAQALEQSARQGLLLDSEADLLAGVVELGEIRVREIMTPRVDTLMLDLSEQDPSEIVARAVESKVAWLVATDGNPDRVVGRIRVRDLLTKPDTPLAEMVEATMFVPEVATALGLLEQLRERGVAVAVVVDEWGGTAGVARLEDILEEVVGELRIEGEDDIPPVEDLGNGSFAVLGDLQIRDWNELFGRRVVPTEFETVGGFVTALLGRIPRVGDEVHSGGLVFHVREVVRRRIVRLELRVEPMPPTRRGSKPDSGEAGA